LIKVLIWMIWIMGLMILSYIQEEGSETMSKEATRNWRFVKKSLYVI
jgi:hypothetical protein